MTIESAISGVGALMVNPGHEDKAKQESHPQKRKKNSQNESAESHPAPRVQWQTTGMLIDITV